MTERWQRYPGGMWGLVPVPDPGLTACPECAEVAVTRTQGPLPVCLSCDWTGWPECPAGGPHTWGVLEEAGTGRTAWGCEECHYVPPKGTEP